MATTFSRNKRLAASKRLRASHLMSSNPISIPHTASARKAAQLLNACRIQIAPVIDEDGRLIGVVRNSDLFDFCENDRDRRGNTSNRGTSASNLTNCGIYLGHNRAGTDPAVLQIMSTEVYSVWTDASITKVINQFVRRGIRRLFVTDRDAVLVGEINIFELLRKLGKIVVPIRNAGYRL